LSYFKRHEKLSARPNIQRTKEACSLYNEATTEKKTSKNIKEKMIYKVTPKVDKIKINDMRQTKANSIVMEFDTRSDLQKFKDHPKLEMLQIEEP